MRLEDVKRGQRVRVVAPSGNLFYSYTEGCAGRVSYLDGDLVHVEFENGDDDFGYAAGLELITDIQVKAPTPSSPPEPTPASVKDAIADVEKALAVLKALVG